MLNRIVVDRIIGQQKEAAKRQQRQEGVMKFDPPDASSGPSTTAPLKPTSLPQRPSLPAPLQKITNQAAGGGLKSSLDSWRQKILPPKPSHNSEAVESPSSTFENSGIRPPPNRSQNMTPTANIGKLGTSFRN